MMKMNMERDVKENPRMAEKMESKSMKEGEMNENAERERKLMKKKVEVT